MTVIDADQIARLVSARDYFAGCAMMALVSRSLDTRSDEDIARAVSRRAFALADAMMKAREGGS